MAEPVFQKPPPEGDGSRAAEAEALLVALLLGSFLIVARVAGGDRGQRPALLRQRRRRALPQRPLQTRSSASSPRSTAASRRTSSSSAPTNAPARRATRAAPTRRCCCASTPTRNAIALMSIPRDLKVEIPGVGTDKFNAAYTYGGPKLTLQVVKELTGLPINHVVNVDFLGFVRRSTRSAASTSTSTAATTTPTSACSPPKQYAEINVQPGYQLMCGKKALEYVRYRHTDTDLVRAARQQDFLSAARQRVPVEELVLGREQADRDLHRIHDLRHQRRRDDDRSAETVHRLAQRRDQRGPLPGRTGPELSSPPRRQRSKARSTSSSASKPAAAPRGSLEGTEADERAEATRRRRRARRRRRRSRASRRRSRPAATNWCPPAKPARLEAKIVARKVGGGFPVFYPTRLPSGAAFEESNPYLTDPGPARLPLQGHRRQPRTPPTGWCSPSTSRTAPTTSASRGSGAGRIRRSSATRAKRER